LQSSTIRKTLKMTNYVDIIFQRIVWYYSSRLR